MANKTPEKKERNQRVFQMWQKDKMTQANIARKMNISPGRVRQIITRELKRNQ